MLNQEGETPYRYADNAFVNDYRLLSETERKGSTPHHEVLHLLRGVSGHHLHNVNVLVDGGGTTTEITGSRRITKSQEEEIYEHAAVTAEGSQ